MASTFGRQYKNQQSAMASNINVDAIRSGEVVTAKLASSCSDRAVSIMKDKSIEDERDF